MFGYKQNNDSGIHSWPAVIFIVLLILSILFLAPTFGVLLSSVKTTRDIALGELWKIPSELYFGNYVEVLSNPAVGQYLSLIHI